MVLTDDSRCGDGPGEQCIPAEPTVFETDSDGAVTARCSCGMCGSGIDAKYVPSGEPQCDSVNAYDDGCYSIGYHDMEELGTLIAAGGGSLVRTSECLRCNSRSVERFELEGVTPR